MANRHADALEIQENEVSLGAIARTLVTASDEARREGLLPAEDAACTLMVHRLACLCKIGAFIDGFTLHAAAMEECRVKAAA